MIHPFKMNGLNIVMDVNSGAIHHVDDLAYAILDFINQHKKNMKEAGLVQELASVLPYALKDIEETFAELLELYNEGLLFSPQPDYDYKSRQPVVKALCLHIAHDCNLRCTYCFAGDGEYKGKKEHMSLEVGKKAIDFLIENSGGRKQLEVDFFGGEPLLNFDVVKEIVRYGNEVAENHGKVIRFTITTNGLLLDEEKTAFINAHMSNVVLSLDGRKAVHDKFRQTAGGNGSYDVVLPKVLNLVQQRGQKDYYVRGTFTRENLDFSADVFHLYNAGFQHVSVEPVVGDEKTGYTIKAEDLPAIFKEYEKLAHMLLTEEHVPNFFHFNIDLQSGPCLSKRVSGCGCGVEYLAVTPSGELYPCHQFVGEEQFKLGTIFDGVLNQAIVEEFEKTNVFTKEKCQDCFAKYYCSGGCFANSYFTNKDINKPCDIACSLQQKRVECAIMMKVFENSR